MHIQLLRTFTIVYTTTISAGKSKQSSCLPTLTMLHCGVRLQSIFSEFGSEALYSHPIGIARTFQEARMEESCRFPDS